MSKVGNGNGEHKPLLANRTADGAPRPRKNEPLNVYSTFHNPYDSWSSASFRFVITATAWVTTPWAVYAKLDETGASTATIAVATSIACLLIVLLPTIFNVDNDKEHNGPVSVPSYVRIGIELFVIACAAIAPWFIPECTVGMKSAILILVLLSLVSGAERWYYLEQVRKGEYYDSLGYGASDTDLSSMGPMKQVESALSLLVTDPENIDAPLGMYTSSSERVSSSVALVV